MTESSKKDAKKIDNCRLADFLFEAGTLRRVPRSGFHYLGDRRESVAEHTLRVVFAAWLLARVVPAADRRKMVEMALFHDFAEARTGDLNAVSKVYVTAAEELAVADACDGLPFGDEIQALIAEWRRGETLEARLARDADHIDMLLSLKEELDIGNERAAEWIPAVVDRIQTDAGRELAKAINEAQADRWWLERLLRFGAGSV